MLLTSTLSLLPRNSNLWLLHGRKVLDVFMLLLARIVAPPFKAGDQVMPLQFPNSPQPDSWVVNKTFPFRSEFVCPASNT